MSVLWQTELYVCPTLFLNRKNCTSTGQRAHFGQQSNK